jgi:hypothetical protein
VELVAAPGGGDLIEEGVHRLAGPSPTRGNRNFVA